MELARSRAVSPQPVIERKCNGITPGGAGGIVWRCVRDAGKPLGSARVAVYRTWRAAGSGRYFLRAAIETEADYAYTCAHRAALA